MRLWIREIVAPGAVLALSGVSACAGKVVLDPGTTTAGANGKSGSRPGRDHHRRIARESTGLPGPAPAPIDTRPASLRSNRSAAGSRLRRFLVVGQPRLRPSRFRTDTVHRSFEGEGRPKPSRAEAGGDPMPEGETGRRRSD